MFNSSLNRVGPLVLFGYEENDTAVRIFYDIAYFNTGYLPYYEFLTCVICICANGYSSFRFMNAGTYSRNFRIVMIATNLIISGIALLRPICFLVPEEEYRLKTKNYVLIFTMYSLGYISQVCVLIFDVKYIIIGFERRMAFKNRATYEHSQDRTTIRVFLGILCTVIAIASVKAIVFVTLRDLPIDVALHKAFMMDSDFVTWLITHFIALAGWAYGFYTFHVLSKEAHKIRYAGSSLTESFTIKEIENVIKVIKPVIKAYILLMIVAITIVTFMLPCFYYGVMNERDMYYQAMVTFEYVMVDTYNVYSSCYMIWNFKPLRRALKQDITSCFRKKCFTVDVEPDTVEKYSAIQGTDLYFEQLTKSWKLDSNKK